MKTMGIRQLKDRLSEVLREVRGGETVRVTDRGRTVALLTAPPAAARGEAPHERLAREGWIVPAREPGVRDFFGANPRTGGGAPPGTACAVLDWSRADSPDPGS